MSAFIALTATVRPTRTRPPLRNIPRPTTRRRRPTSQLARVVPCPDVLQTLSLALHTWHTRTSTPPNNLPTDSDLRRCAIAKELRLRTLISRAGGHKTVQSLLNLSPPPTSRQKFRGKELIAMARTLHEACERNGLPPPEKSFPSRLKIRELSPGLANRIAAFPGRDGYGRLAEHVKAPLDRQRSVSRDWGVWTDSDALLSELSKHQPHPRVLPRLCALPKTLASAVQRKGGAATFAQRHRLVLEKDWANLVRWATLVRWLADESPFPEGGYLQAVQQQASSPSSFPASSRVEEAEKAADVARYGGRKSMALRLGFARHSGIKHVFMGPFSVRFAADLLAYATERVFVADDGSVAMPSIEFMSGDGQEELAEAVTYFGGEEEVGRRLGLVPLGWTPLQTVESMDMLGMDSLLLG